MGGLEHDRIDQSRERMLTVWQPNPVLNPARPNVICASVFGRSGGLTRLRPEKPACAVDSELRVAGRLPPSLRYGRLAVGQAEGALREDIAYTQE